jgi:hypothetical protein
MSSIVGPKNDLARALRAAMQIAKGTPTDDLTKTEHEAPRER